MYTANTQAGNYKVKAVADFQAGRTMLDAANNLQPRGDFTTKQHQNKQLSLHVYTNNTCENMHQQHSKVSTLTQEAAILLPRCTGIDNGCWSLPMTRQGHDEVPLPRFSKGTTPGV